METFRKTFAFVIGALIVLVGITDECPRAGAIIVGLLIMGVFTVPEAIGFFRGFSQGMKGEDQ